MDENNKPLGLKWHKFMIYCLLWLIVALLLLVSKGFMDGVVYGNMAKSVYEAYPILRRFDSIYAIYFIVLALYHVYVRYQLAGFKAGAPKKLLATHLIAGASISAYPPIAMVLTGVTFPVIGVFPPLIVGVLLFMINKPYYDHRKELFVN